MQARAAIPLTELRLGSYEPLVELASGGMATIYVARKSGPAGFERLVVIKRVHPHLLKDREFCDMFRDEARICSTIRHPNVTSLFDVVEADGELFLVLEYVESVSLSELVKAAAQATPPRLSPPVLARIFADMLAGLHAAHEAVDLRGNRLDLIHRDISPQNVIVGADGTSRLIDFGISKATSRISATNSGVLKGKLRYMSPEQVKQQPLDRRADIFAAGTVFFESLTGRRLFEGEDEGDIALGIMLADVPAPSSIVADLPAELDAVLARALARDRTERFQTALEFHEALEGAIAPASARDVARVVESLCKELLESRRAALSAALDEAASGRVPTSPRVDTSVPVAQPEAAEPTLRDARPGRNGVRIAIGAALAIACVGIAGAIAAKRASSSVANAASSSAASPTAPGPSEAASEGAVEPASAKASAASAAPTASSSASASTSASAPGSAARPAGKPTGPKRDLHRRNPYATP